MLWSLHHISHLYIRISLADFGTPGARINSWQQPAASIPPTKCSDSSNFVLTCENSMQFSIRDITLAIVLACCHINTAIYESNATQHNTTWISPPCMLKHHKFIKSVKSALSKQPATHARDSDAQCISGEHPDLFRSSQQRCDAANLPPWSAALWKDSQCLTWKAEGCFRQLTLPLLSSNTPKYIVYKMVC